MSAPAIPVAAAELEDMLGDGKRMKALFNEDGSAKPEFGELVGNYARAVNQKDQTIATQVREETQRLLAKWLKENGEEVTNRPNLNPMDVQAKAQKGGLRNPKAPGAVLDKEFSNSADYFRTIWHNTDRDQENAAKLKKLRNAFSSTVPSEGGFLVPEVLRSELLKVSLETSIVRPRARVVPMESSRVPFPMVDSTSNVSSVHGGIIGYWTEEGAALTGSNPSFGRLVLDAKKLTTYCEVPNELISDSVSSFQTFIDEMFPEALGFYEDDAFINGTGVGEPLGFLNAPAAISVTKETGQAADTIVWENVIKMYSRMLPGSLNRAVWIVSPNTFPELATMALSVGTGGSAVWLNNGVDGPPATILGRPVIISEKVSTLGDAGDINFVDLGFYLIGDRQAMSATSSGEYKFGNDLTAYRIIERVDGRPWLQSAITPKNNGSTLSPFVKVAERA